MLKRIVLSAALVAGACGACGADAPAVDAGGVPDSEPLPDAAPPFVPIVACATEDEAVGLVPDSSIHTSFYDSAFYFRAGTSAYHLRAPAMPSDLVHTGESYAPGGEGAELELLGLDSPQIFMPIGYGACPTVTDWALRAEFRRLGPNGPVLDDVVLLVDDLTGDLTHVMAEGDAYAGSVVKTLWVLARSRCGDLGLLVELADGRALLVRRAAVDGTFETLLTVAPFEGPTGPPIPGTTDRYYGILLEVSLEDDQALFEAVVEDGTRQQVGRWLGSVAYGSKQVTCRVTSAHIPCLLEADPGMSAYGWSQAADTAATYAGQIVRDGVTSTAFEDAGAVDVCAATGEVYFLKAVAEVQEVFVVRRDDRVERVTRNSELQRSGEPAASWVNSIYLSPTCDLVLEGGGENGSASWVYWADATLAVLPDGYSIRGYAPDGSLGIRDHAGHMAIAHRPAAATCKVLPAGP